MYCIYQGKTGKKQADRLDGEGGKAVSQLGHLVMPQFINIYTLEDGETVSQLHMSFL
jgi:hypothetical protein